MTFEKFKMIMAECHIDDPMYINDEYLLEAFNQFELDKYPDDKPYLCLATPIIDGKSVVLVFWVDPRVRRRAIGTKLLSHIPTPHKMVVDYRSIEMHKLLASQGYKSETSYIMGDNVIHLHGGDKLYYKD